MRLVTLRLPGHLDPGVMVGESVLNLRACSAVLPDARLVPTSLRGVLEAGDAALDLVRGLRDRAFRPAEAQALRETGALVAAENARLAAPIPDPGMILSAGMNYHAHLKEMNTPTPARPTAFLKAPSAVIGPGEAILLPRSNPDMVDWEGEFCAVIGRTCHGVNVQEALEYVAGYTLVNDVSARDWVAPVFAATGVMGPILAWEANILGKQFPTFCPMGPVLATRDEVPDPGNVRLETRVNGVVVQSTHTDDLVFGVAALIAHYSRFMRLRPGDVLTTGSPGGVGYGRNPKVFLRAGDAVEVEAQGIGTLANPVAAA